MVNYYSNSWTRHVHRDISYKNVQTTNYYQILKGGIIFQETIIERFCKIVSNKMVVYKKKNSKYIFVKFYKKNVCPCWKYILSSSKFNNRS